MCVGIVEFGVSLYFGDDDDFVFELFFIDCYVFVVYDVDLLVYVDVVMFGELWYVKLIIGGCDSGNCLLFEMLMG